jgi:hypothetical protein
VTLPPPRLLLDNGCLIAAQSAGERWHPACIALVEAGRSGRAHLMRSVTVEYDLETAGEPRRSERLAWLQANPFIERVPGPFMPGVTRIEWGDAYVGDEHRDPLARLHAILGKPPDSERRAHFDYHHACTAYLRNADALVTTDNDDLLKKRDAVRVAVGLVILDPEEAVHLVGLADTVV